MLPHVSYLQKIAEHHSIDGTKDFVIQPHKRKKSQNKVVTLTLGHPVDLALSRQPRPRQKMNRKYSEVFFAFYTKNETFCDFQEEDMWTAMYLNLPYCTANVLVRIAGPQDGQAGRRGRRLLRLQVPEARGAVGVCGRLRAPPRRADGDRGARAAVGAATCAGECAI